MIIFVRLKILLLFSGIVMGERDGSFIKRLQIKTKLFYSTMTARSALECAIACFMDNRCGAANFNTAIEQCQLIDESIASTEEQFISNVDWTILTVDCGTPTNVPNTVVSPGTSTFGSVREYQCKSGYHSISVCSKMVTTCQATSQWTPPDCGCWSQGALDACSSNFLWSVPDSALSASSFWPNPRSHGPERSRLNTVEDIHIGAWSAATNDVNQWLQVDLQDTVLFRGVITQGRHSSFHQWVTAFKALYSEDCKTWTYVGGINETETIFSANSDRDTEVTNMFQCPVRGRCIRLNPVSWHHHVSMRFDVIGCAIG